MVQTHIAQLNAACAMVLTRVAPAVSITCPSVAQASGLPALASRVAAQHGLRASIGVAQGAITVRISHAPDSW